MKKNAFILFLFFLPVLSFSQANIIATAAQDTICQGESVGLLAEGDTFDFYTWSPASWITNISTPNPTVTPPVTTTYTVSGFLLGDNVIVNGDFSDGNTGFSTEYLHGPDTGGGPWGDLSDEGTYAITTNSNIVHSNFANCTDHTTGFGNMLVVNGSGVPNTGVWCQTVNVIPNTSYEFSTWVTSVVTSNPAELQFSINGDLLGNTFAAPSSGCIWEQFFEIWESGGNTSAEICIVNQNVAVGGNDFALDDISFSPAFETIDSITVYVSDISAVVANEQAIGCDGTPGSASVAVNGGFGPYTYLWDNGETTEIATDLSPGIHALTITDAVGCATVVNVNIQEPVTPEIDDVTIENTTCGLANGLLEIFPSSLGTPPYLYSIDGMSFQPEAIFTDVAAGTFFAVIEDAAGCTGAFEVTIEPSFEPIATINTPHGLDLCGELPVLLDAGETFESYEWSTGETASLIQPTEDGNYAVTVTDANGCTAINSIEIDPCGSWEMPNGFTPDGDGINDTFGPVIEGNAYQIVSFKIFNRWGNLVHDDNTPWDGEVDGSPHPMDVLVYFLVIEGDDGVEEVKGDVSLIR